MEVIKRQIFVLRDTLKDIIDYNIGTDMVPIEYHVMDFTVPATAAAVVYVLKPDGDLDKILADVLDNVISFKPTKGFFLEGLNAIQIRVVDNNKALVSFTETVRAGKSMKFDDNAEAQQETLIEQLLTKMGESDGNMKIERAERIAGDENEKAERKAEIDVERQRINNLAKLQEGSTTGDAELADIRVGADGKNYENAGDAVRGQVTALKEDLNENIVYLNNLNNYKTIDNYNNAIFLNGFEIGGITSSGGNITASNYSIRTIDYITAYGKHYFEHDIEIGIEIFKYSTDKVFEKRIIIDFAFEFEGDKLYKLLFYNKNNKAIKRVNEILHKVFVLSEPSLPIEDVKKKMENERTFLINENLVNPVSIEHGYYQRGNGEFILDEAFRCCKVPVFPEGTYYIKNKDLIVTFYDKNKKFLTSIPEHTLKQNIVTVPENCFYMGTSVTAEEEQTMYVTTVEDGFIPYSKKILVKRSDIDYSTLKSSVLADKTINVMGDSITGTDYTRPTWWEIIAERTGAKFNNYGISGTTIAHNNERHFYGKEPDANYNPEDASTWDTGNCFCERVDEMSILADGVIVMGGTNDNYKGKGTWDSTDTRTFYGALNVLITELLKAYPGKPILFCTMIQKPDSYKSNTENPLKTLLDKTLGADLTMEDRALCIKMKCEQYGVTCLDLYHCSGINGVDSETIYYKNDLLHPSHLAQERLANLIQDKLEVYWKEK